MLTRELVAAFIEADPEFVHELEDAADVQRLLDELVRFRKTSGLRQRDVAERMKVSQPTVSEFESESSDPRLATVQRYARAVGARVRLKVEFPPSNLVRQEDWSRSVGWKSTRSSASKSWAV